MTAQVTDLRAVTGMIFEVQRFSVHDGPGIRTTVFMKGCPLRCRWCHNPEGVSSKPELSFTPSKCIGCGYCLRVCPRNAHRFTDHGHELDRSVCAVCGSCTEECYARALELVGRETTAGETIDLVLRDRVFYETSGGGMTLSGGEPTFQFPFAEALLRLAR
ncbi:MAG TPA: glycyl-radical enzyme activating protein, partial [Candidatus Hydrogenedentes bacterium]|nr:glycyl-radical enzyme activating protein [Candidatus Hydrogenedentota bacterium]